jgi:hypothetical protein
VRPLRVLCDAAEVHSTLSCAPPAVVSVVVAGAVAAVATETGLDALCAEPPPHPLPGMSTKRPGTVKRKIVVGSCSAQRPVAVDNTDQGPFSLVQPTVARGESVRWFLSHDAVRVIISMPTEKDGANATSATATPEGEPGSTMPDWRTR